MNFLSKSKKFRKYFKVRKKQIERFPKFISKTFSLQILQQFDIRIEHLTLCSKLLKKYLKPYRKSVIIRWKVFPDTIVTKKPKDVRMGRGKGLVVYKHSPMRAGAPLFELSNISEKIAKLVIFKCSKKLPVQSLFIKGPLFL